MRVRKNVSEITDDTLLWYSRAVEAMKKKDITDQQVGGIKVLFMVMD